MFNLFLRTTNKLEIYVKQMPNANYQISLMNVDMSLPLKSIIDKGQQTIRVTKKAITIKGTTLPVIDPDRYYLTKIVIE